MSDVPWGDIENSLEPPEAETDWDEIARHAGARGAHEPLVHDCRRCCAGISPPDIGDCPDCKGSGRLTDRQFNLQGTIMRLTEKRRVRRERLGLE